MTKLAMYRELSASQAANKANGHVALTVGAAGGLTASHSLRESGPLRLRFPNTTSGMREAVLLNTAGGVLGGDHLSVDIVLRQEARVLWSTAAAEKVYRAKACEAQIETRISVSASASLTWLPHETILFDGARLSRTIEIGLETGASLLAAEAIVLGRTAMDESFAKGRLFDRWRVRRDGQLIYADTLRLDGAMTGLLSKRAAMNGGVALATLLLHPGSDAQVASIRVAADQCVGEFSASCWNGIALARFCAPTGATLRHDLLLALHALCAPLPRAWLT